jgi:protein-tyrosine phosphatase
VTGRVPGTFNFRDLGGYRAEGGITREGVLMRSDALVSLGPAGRAALARLDIQTAIDLREPVERQLDPADLDGVRIELHSNPVFAGGMDLDTPKGLPELYRDVLDSCGDRLAGAVRLLCRPAALPAVIFCSAGKDRTGLLSALILSAVGVEDDDVARDYTLTESVLEGEFRERLVRRARAAGLSEQALAVKLGAPEELMLELLGELRVSHGGAAAYLAAHGLQAEELQALRRALVGGP